MRILRPLNNNNAMTSQRMDAGRAIRTSAHAKQRSQHDPQQRGNDDQGNNAAVVEINPGGKESVIDNRKLLVATLTFKGRP